VWLALGGVLFLTYSSSRLAIARWTVFWSATSILVLASAPLVPLVARLLWIAGVGTLVAARVFRASLVRGERTLERAALAVLGLFAVYIVATSTATRVARSQVRDALAALGIDGVEQVMVGPSIGNPFGGEVVAATADTYYLGHWSWLAATRLNLAGDPVPRPSGAVFDAAARAPEARKFLTWSRFPVIDTEPQDDGGLAVHFADARYRGRGGLDGPTVRLDAGLRVTAAE
jgi:hypothetical protein